VRLERWLVLAAMSLFLLSLAMPAVHGSGFPGLSGIDMLRQGSGAWRNGVVAWYANPLFGLGLLLAWSGYYRLACAAAATSLLLGLSSFTAADMAARSGRAVPEFSYAGGFYVWLAALLLLVAATVVGIYKVSRARHG